MGQTADQLYDRYRQVLEEEIRESIAGEDGLLHNMLLYQLGWMDEQGTPLSGPSGERLHPTLCLLSSESALGDYRPALPAAAAVELVYNYTLIHEDVQSGSPNRGNRASVWWIWGPGQAINAGDGMHALARLTLMGLLEKGVPDSRVLRAMQLLDQSCLRMCEGQHLDLVFQEKLSIGIDNYLTMAAGRRGALTSCAMGLGALAVTEDEGTLEAFKRSGECLGIALQIAEDVKELVDSTTGDQPAASVLNKRKLLPIVYVLEKGDIHTKRELGTIYFKRVLEPDDVKQVIAILNEMSALDYARGRAREYTQLAVDALAEVHLTATGREQLQNFCQQVTSGIG